MLKIKKILCFALVSCILLGSSVMNAVAASDESMETEVEVMDAEITPILEIPYALTRSTDFSDASILTSKGSEGEMVIQIATYTSAIASVVGVKDVVVYKKSFLKWTEVATSSGGETYNAYGLTCVMRYYGAEEGKTYKISCTHYANVDGYREYPNETGDFKFNF